MLTEANGEVWGKPGPAGWATRWVLGTALGQIVFTGTVRLVLAVLMGAALGGLAVWLVLRRRPTPRRYDSTPTAGATGRPARPVRHDATPPSSGADRSTTTRKSAHPGRQSRPPAGRVRPRFSPRADGAGRATPGRATPGRATPGRPTPGRPSPGWDTRARGTVNGAAGGPTTRPTPTR